MRSLQLSVTSQIIDFPQYRAARLHRKSTSLSASDRLDVSNWREVACRAGYDRLVIYEREGTDANEVGNFLSVYRGSEAWARWVFARRGAVIQAWCGVTWADQGEFDTLAQALEAVLGIAGPASVLVERADHADAVVTDLMPRLRACHASKFGSAA